MMSGLPTPLSILILISPVECRYEVNQGTASHTCGIYVKYYGRYSDRCYNLDVHTVKSFDAFSLNQKLNPNIKTLIMLKRCITELYKWLVFHIY